MRLIPIPSNSRVILAPDEPVNLLILCLISFSSPNLESILLNKVIHFTELFFSGLILIKYL
jgi:hypothetical protein